MCNRTILSHQPVEHRSVGHRCAARRSPVVRFLQAQVLALAIIGTGLVPAAVSTATAATDVTCKLSFTMSGWSAFYKTASGSGTIKCSNGQSAVVKLEAKGGGLTVGKSTIENGQGEFSGVKNIEETLGSYVAAEAHAGAVKSSHAQVMTKGEVSLALSGTGRGWDLGIAFGKLSITR